MSNNKKNLWIGIAVVVGLIALWFFGHSGKPETAQTTPNPAPNAGTVRETDSFVNGADLGSQRDFWKDGFIQRGSGVTSVIVWRNTTGKKARAQYGEMGWDVGTASGTPTLTLFATTSSSVPADKDYATINATTSMLAQKTYASSTSATTTTNFNSSYSNGTIEIPDGWYLLGYVQSKNCVIQSACASATSTEMLGTTTPQTTTGFFFRANIHQTSIY